MAFVLRRDVPKRWETIDLKEAGSFEVLMKKPTWGDLVSETETFEGYAERRMRAVVAGWRGLVDESGAALSFSWENLVALCESCPLAFQRLTKLVAEAFVSVGETERKNSAPPSSESTAEIPAAPESTAASSAN